MFPIIAAIVIFLWLLGLVLKIGGALIHLLLVVTLVVTIFHMFTGKRPIV